MSTLTRPPAPEETVARTAPKKRTVTLWGLKREVPALVLILILTVLVIVPVAFVAIAAFSTAVPRPGNPETGRFTFGNLTLLTTADGLSALFNSLLIGLGSSVLALLIGATLAFICSRTDAPLRKFIFIIGMAPMFVPALVGALAWSLLASPSAGFINILLRDLGIPLTINIYSLGGLIFVLGLFYAPYVFLLVHSSLSLMNADLEEASSVHGATLKTMFRTVTLPLALPSLLGSGILVFALTMENFPVAAVLGNPAGINTLPTYIYRLMSASPPEANKAASIAMLLTVALLVVTLWQQRIVNKRKFTTMTGKGNRPRQIPLRKLRWPATIFALAYFVVSVLAPLLALVIAAMQDSPYLSSLSQLVGTLSFDRLGEVLSASDFQLALRNSVLVALMAAVVGTALSFIVSYIRYRTTSRLGQGMEVIAMAPLAIPSIVLGMGILWTWLTLPLPVYGTLAILGIACMAVFLPQGYRSISSSMLQLDKDLEDSAVMLGAHRVRAVFSVTIPLMRVGITSTVLLYLMLSMRELSASLFLFTSETRILSILVFDSFDNGQTTGAAAISVFYILVIAVLAIGAQMIGSRSSKKKKNPISTSKNLL